MDGTVLYACQSVGVTNVLTSTIHLALLGPTPSPTPQQEVGQLEAELVQLHSRIQELEAQLAAVGEDEGAALQVTIALSSCELQVEEKRRRLAALQVCGSVSKVELGSCLLDLISLVPLESRRMGERLVFRLM